MFRPKPTTHEDAAATAVAYFFRTQSGRSAITQEQCVVGVTMENETTPQVVCSCVFVDGRFVGSEADKMKIPTSPNIKPVLHVLNLQRPVSHSGLKQCNFEANTSIRKPGAWRFVTEPGWVVKDGSDEHVTNVVDETLDVRPPGIFYTELNLWYNCPEPNTAAWEQNFAPGRSEFVRGYQPGAQQYFEREVAIRTAWQQSGLIQYAQQHVGADNASTALLIPCDSSGLHVVARLDPSNRVAAIAARCVDLCRAVVDMTNCSHTYMRPSTVMLDKASQQFRLTNLGFVVYTREEPPRELAWNFVPEWLAGTVDLHETLFRTKEPFDKFAKFLSQTAALFSTADHLKMVDDARAAPAVAPSSPKEKSFYVNQYVFGRCFSLFFLGYEGDKLTDAQSKFLRGCIAWQPAQRHRDRNTFVREFYSAFLVPTDDAAAAPAAVARTPAAAARKPAEAPSTTDAPAAAAARKPADAPSTTDVPPPPPKGGTTFTQGDDTNVAAEAAGRQPEIQTPLQFAQVHNVEEVAQACECLFGATLPDLRRHTVSYNSFTKKFELQTRTSPPDTQFLGEDWAPEFLLQQFEEGEQIADHFVACALNSGVAHMPTYTRIKSYSRTDWNSVPTERTYIWRFLSQLFAGKTVPNRLLTFLKDCGTAEGRLLDFKFEIFLGAAKDGGDEVTKVGMSLAEVPPPLEVIRSLHVTLAAFQRAFNMPKADMPYLNTFLRTLAKFSAEAFKIADQGRDPLKRRLQNMVDLWMFATASEGEEAAVVASKLSQCTALSQILVRAGLLE